jgi:hypothetical protein
MSMTKTFRFALMFAAAMLASSLPALAINTGGTSVPEPGTMALLATGLGAVGVVRRFLTK